jgi:hypothetical protein
MFAGRKPFQSENVGEVILMQREAAPPKLRSVAADARYSVELEALIDKAMSKLPEDRFQSAAELAAALAATQEGKAAGQEMGIVAIPPDAKADVPKADGKKGDGKKADAKNGKQDQGKDEKKGQARPAPAATIRQDAKTTIDTVSAVRRRMEANEAGASAAPVRQFRMAWIGALFVVVALLALLIGRGLRHGGGEVTGATTRPSTATTPTAAGAAVPSGDNQGLEQARQMIARGEIDPAIALLNQLRTQQPDNADVPYLLAMVNFDNRRWPDGLAAAQMAVRKNPALKADPDLIKGAIRSLVSDRGYDRSQAFLRSLGQPAMPFIKEAAARDPSPKVRDRAAELLGSSGRWGSRPSSGGSMFRR